MAVSLTLNQPGHGGIPLCVLVLCCRIPISWKQLELDSTISWIGWRFNFQSCFVALPMNKLDKFDTICNNSRFSKKIIGIMMGVNRLFPYMHIWRIIFTKICMPFQPCTSASTEIIGLLWPHALLMIWFFILGHRILQFLSKGNWYLWDIDQWNP